VPPPSLPAGPEQRRGIGIVAPYDFALDEELWRWAPADVTLHATRTPYLSAPVSVAMAEAVSSDVDVRAGVRSLVTVRPAAFVYACTSGSFVRGKAGERQLTTAMREAGAPIAITTSGALVDALAALGIARLSIATPYVPEVTERLHAFLAEGGVEVVRSRDLGLSSDIWTVPYARTAEIVLACDDPRAEAVFVSCTNLPTYDLIAPLEASLGKPILTANQVTMWAVLRALSLRALGPGQRLLEANEP
jgi:maleate isomerase